MLAAMRAQAHQPEPPAPRAATASGTHGADIEGDQLLFQPVDLLAQRQLDLAQLLAGLDDGGAELVDRLDLLRGQLDVVGILVLALADLVQLGLE